jgi:iron(III) transport system substrate-binding protein
MLVPKGKEEGKMSKNGKLFVMIVAIGFLMGIFLLMGTFSVVQGKGLPADVEKWLKENKVGPFQEEKVDYDALYRAAKKEGKVVVYADSSRGPKSLAMGWYEKYPGIKVEWNTLGAPGVISRFTKEQKAGIHNVDVVCSAGHPTHVNVFKPANMVFPWVPPDLKELIPRKFQDPLLIYRVTGQALFYNTYTWPDKPPVKSWWDLTKPEWKGRLVLPDPRIDVQALSLLLTFIKHSKEMAQDYERVFGKPLKLTTPNAGYEWVKMIFANEPKLIRHAKEGKFIGKPGQAKPSLGVVWGLSRITDSHNPKYGNIHFSPNLAMTPKMGSLLRIDLNIAYKAPHPNAAKLMVRWLFGDDKGGVGFKPWFTPGNFPTRTDIKAKAPHPFNPKLTWHITELDMWDEDAVFIWKERRKFLDFVNKQL